MYLNLFSLIVLCFTTSNDTAKDHFALDPLHIMCYTSFNSESLSKTSFYYIFSLFLTYLVSFKFDLNEQSYWKHSLF